ncbi:hypothetical protein Nepgr_001210 [Nepenthes gracilis]|uniref:Uncharacterized protein n=1 Tax=Nepenthes gracilis TaxID=150966 RepID=A0AAD3P4F2_NEPGR|nr:hypothetical protein Nepgr_001210 [Nepenthes gracilis]
MVELDGKMAAKHDKSLRWPRKEVRHRGRELFEVAASGMEASALSTRHRPLRTSLNNVKKLQAAVHLPATLKTTGRNYNRSQLKTMEMNSEGIKLHEPDNT